MSEDKNKEIFFTRAEVKAAERIACDNCFESTVFLMKDKDHEFSVGLSTILQCVEFAIKQGQLPKLPDSWCSSIGSRYNIWFDDDAMYHEYHENKEKTENNGKR